MNDMKSDKHVLGLSGGRDSAALAVYMRQTIPSLTFTISLPILAKNYRKFTNFWSSSKGFWGSPSSA